MTASLGGACCRVLSGERRPDVARRDGVRWVVENIRRALEHAESRGVILAMENHYKDGFWKYPEFAQKVDVFLEIVEQIDSPCFGVQFDPSNAVIAGADPVELLERVKHRVVSMHASDRYLAPGTSLEDSRQADGTLGYPENLHHGVVGEGLNDYDRIFRVLAGRPEPPPGLSRASGPQAPGSILSWLRSQGILGSAFGRLGSEGNSSASGAEGFQCGVGKDDGEDRWAIPIRSGDARGRHSVTRRRGRSMG